MAYRDTYLSESRKTRQKSAMDGCVTGTIVTTAIIISIVLEENF